jgi:hypothetical protein
VVFDGTKKSYALNLVNMGDDTAHYDISLIHNKMKGDGSFEKTSLADSTQNHADKNLRFYPHQVILAPHSAQSVRIQVTKWNELDTGEYRSNLYFRARQKINLSEDKTNKDSGISIKVIPVIGISMPIIIQVGKSTTRVNFSNSSVQIVNDTLTLLKATFNRTGNMSVYGDISVEYISAQGKITQVGLLKGIAVYSPNAKRNFTFRLKNPPGVNYQTGRLHIRYSNPLLKETLLTETEIALH